MQRVTPFIFLHSLSTLWVQACDHTAGFLQLYHHSRAFLTYFHGLPASCPRALA